VKVWIFDIALLTWEDSWTAALYNLGSGSWLAWASGTAARYAATHCPQSDKCTRGAARQTYHRSKSAAL